MADPIPTPPTSAEGGVIPPATPAAAETSLGATLYPEGGATPTAAEPAPGEPASDPAVSPPPEPKIEPTALTLDSYKELKLPETVKVDDTLFTSFKDMSLESKVAPEVAQKFLDMYAKNLESQGSSILAAQNEAFVKTQNDWVTEYKSMPEFQGERATQSTAVIGRMMDEFATPRLREDLSRSGFGNHPDLIKMIYDIASTLTEDSVVPSGRPTGSRTARTPGQVFYPDADKPN